MIEKSEEIGFSCNICGAHTITKRGMINLSCLKQGCKGRQLTFDVDVMRRRFEDDKWEFCPAGAPFDSGYLNGTVTSGLYEIIKKEMYQGPVVEVPESIAQFEKVEEVKKVEKPVKKKEENPLISRLAKR